MFVKSTGDKTTDGYTTYYYQCNRSGVFFPKGSGQRRLKSQGSSKINSQCTAAISLTVNHTTQSVKAEVCHTHYAHEPRLDRPNKRRGARKGRDGLAYIAINSHLAINNLKAEK